MRWHLRDIKVAGLTIVFALVAQAMALSPAAAQGGPVVGQTLSPVKEAKMLSLNSSDFPAGGPIPSRFSEFGEAVSPALRWSSPPEGTKSFALLIEDPDAPMERPFVHWVIYDIPAHAHALPQGMPEKGRPADPEGAVQGRNGAGEIGYFGPRPPAGPAHHYHFQLFALDRKLGLAPGADRDDIAEAMRGHILAEGELIGTFKRPE